MPEDKTPEENIPPFEAQVSNPTPIVEPTPEIVETPAVNTPAVEVPADGTVTPEELAAFSQAPVDPVVTPTFDSVEPTTPPSPFGGPVAAGVVTPEPALPQKSPKKKKIIIGAIIIGALALIGGGTAAAYNLWYQNPDKVVLEAVSSLLQQGTSTHKLSVDIKSKDVSIKLTVDAKLAESPASQADVAATVTTDGKDYKVTGSTITDKDGNIYFKLNDVKSLLTQLAGEGADFSAFNDVITKIDGQWVKVSSDDLKSVSEDYSKTQACTTTALKSLDEKATKDEILTLYKKNDFITVGDKIGVKKIDGVASIGYNVDFDEAKAKTFYTGLGETKVGKALTACDSSFAFKASDLDTSTDDSKATGTIQVWSSRFGHQLKELDITTKDDDTTSNIVWNPTFVKGVTVAAPATSVPVSEVITDIENDYTKLYSSFDSSSYSSDFSTDLSTSTEAFKLSSLL